MSHPELNFTDLDFVMK